MITLIYYIFLSAHDAFDRRFPHLTYQQRHLPRAPPRGQQRREQQRQQRPQQQWQLSIGARQQWEQLQNEKQFMWKIVRLRHAFDHKV